MVPRRKDGNPARNDSTTPPQGRRPGADDDPRGALVCLRSGEPLEGVHPAGDGISFRSARAIPGRRVFEIVVSRALLVELQVVGCVPLPAAEDGYLIHARYHNVSDALRSVVHDELARLLGEHA